MLLPGGCSGILLVGFFVISWVCVLLEVSLGLVEGPHSKRYCLAWNQHSTGEDAKRCNGFVWGDGTYWGCGRHRFRRSFRSARSLEMDFLLLVCKNCIRSDLTDLCRRAIL